MFLLKLLQEHGQQASEHGGGSSHAKHVPIIVEKLNHWIGEPVFEIQKAIMPPIYNAVSKALEIFGLHSPDWPGEGKTFDEYMAAGYLPIPTQVVMFLFVAIIAVVVLWLLRRELSVENPTNRQQTFEVGVEMVRGLLTDLVGPNGLKHFPVVATFGLLILLSNLTGMLPDMIAPTANLNVTLALAISSFLYYNYVGIRENGLLGYLKHFGGPVPNILIMFIMFPIEIVSNLARILSLSMRLFGNIFGEEQVSGVISSIMQWILPILIMPLGLLTAVLQTFIFIVLSMVYLGEVSHHSEESHGGAHEHARDHAVAPAH
ncbi:MAG TPA: F0F1 ATP synthase subunit A [Blastocatellia bacterium]